ncbi:hypothetical protein C7449_11213 [Mycoplana dimorpha]|uniref:Uncharacterized protein n=1 Tax=Mycoplana dimorpha TaxID=28320 RepID=A0A2T5ANV0_MYCDI|nr:hypothetical protein C7449_11213 [Mycoplana dimorpha]
MEQRNDVSDLHEIVVRVTPKVRKFLDDWASIHECSLNDALTECMMEFMHEGGGYLCLSAEYAIKMIESGSLAKAVEAHKAVLDNNAT